MLNRVVLMGRLTEHPVLSYTRENTPVLSFSLAVQRTYQKDQTDFITVVAWRQTAEFIGKYFSKGQLMALEGRIQTRGYTDKGGNKRTAFEVVAEQVFFAEGKKAEEFPKAENGPVKGSSFSLGSLDDFEEVNTSEEDLPF
jgi:single-strand DNA-binding protein